MAHILFLSPYYLPEKAAAAVCISETARGLVKRGHRVTILTTVPSYPDGIVPPVYRGRLLQEELLDDVRVIRVWSFVGPNTSFARRIIAQLSFALLAPLLGGKAVGHPDVIIVQSPPLLDAIAGRMLAFWKRCPFIFMVSDLWPEVAIQLGVLRNRVIIKLARWLEWSTYRRAGLVWVQSEPLRDLFIRSGLPADQVFCLTNGVNIRKFYPQSQEQARAELGWDGRFTLLHAGNHGLLYSLETVLKAAEKMRDDPDVHFVFVGNGVTKGQLVERVRRSGLENVSFLDAVPHEGVPRLLAATDCCLVSLRKLPMSAMAMPVKMLEALACARPILLGVDGEARRLVVGAGAALYVEPENEEALVSAIRYLRVHPDRARLMGQRGRILAEEQFDYDLLTERLDTYITQLLNAASSSMTREHKSEQEEARVSAVVGAQPTGGGLAGERVPERYLIPAPQTKEGL